MSVISGAALYSAIQESKATALLTDIYEVGKAWEQYLLDTGVDLPAYDSSHATGKHFRNMSGLIEDNGVVGWKGPYLSYEKLTAYPKYLQYPGADGLTLISARSTTWGDSVGWQSGFCTSKNDKCYIWVYISQVEESIFKAIDERIDGSDGKDAGDVRFQEPSDIINIKLYAYPSPEYQ